jgi:hypothetical protein
VGLITAYGFTIYQSNERLYCTMTSLTKGSIVLTHRIISIFLRYQASQDTCAWRRVLIALIYLILEEIEEMAGSRTSTRQM